MTEYKWLLTFSFYFVFCTLNHVAFCNLKNFQRDETTDLKYAVFKDHLSHVLDVTKIDATFVETGKHCLLRCVKNQRCFSTNIAAIHEEDGKVLCELLPTDKYNSSTKFRRNRRFHHFSIVSPCESAPCQHGGTCRAMYETDDYKCDCKEGSTGKHCEHCPPIVMENRAIGDAQISASSSYDYLTAPKQARLHLQVGGGLHGGWSAGALNANQWLQVDLNSETEVTDVATQGRNGNIQNNVYQWVTSYKLQYSDHGVAFQYYKEQGQSSDKMFNGNNDRDTVVKHILNPTITARYIRFRPVTWSGWMSMRVELYSCDT